MTSRILSTNMAVINFIVIFCACGSLAWAGEDGEQLSNYSKPRCRLEDILEKLKVDKAFDSSVMDKRGNGNMFRFGKRGDMFRFGKREDKSELEFKPIYYNRGQLLQKLIGTGVEEKELPVYMYERGWSSRFRNKDSAKI